MTAKMHITEARAAGFTIDSHCNPPIAYKGPRFNPTSVQECYTELESALVPLLELVKSVAADTNSIHSAVACQLLDQELLATVGGPVQEKVIA